jgi:hypothetical protein
LHLDGWGIDTHHTGLLGDVRASGERVLADTESGQVHTDVDIAGFHTAERLATAVAVAGACPIVGLLLTWRVERERRRL